MLMPKKAQKPEPQDKGVSLTVYLVMIAVFVVVAIAAYTIVGDLYSNAAAGNLSVFQNNFDSASRIAIYVPDYNSTTLSSAGTCADKLITSVITDMHRNSGSIDYFIFNSTNCTYVRGLGANASNGTTTSVQNCLSISGSEPTVYFNYSHINKTVIEPDIIRTSGDSMFLSECGIATEIS
jgi:hypothetical protein